jgi:hypothetical protein
MRSVPLSAAIEVVAAWLPRPSTSTSTSTSTCMWVVAVSTSTSTSTSCCYQYVTSVGYAQLSKITAVEGLHLNNTSITNQDLLHLTQLTQLTRLCLHGNENILDDDLAMLTLGSLPLQSLSLLNMNITDDGLSCVAQMTSLTALELYGICGFTEVGLQGVLLLPQLRSFVPPSDANWVTWASEWLIAQVKPHLLVCPARPVCCHTAWSIEFDTVRTDCMYEGYSTARTSCVSTSSPE